MLLLFLLRVVLGLREWIFLRFRLDLGERILVWLLLLGQWHRFGNWQRFGNR